MLVGWSSTHRYMPFKDCSSDTMSLSQGLVLEMSLNRKKIWSTMQHFSPYNEEQGTIFRDLIFFKPIQSASFHGPNAHFLRPRCMLEEMQIDP